MSLKATFILAQDIDTNDLECVITPDRWQSKMLILSTNADKKNH